MTHIVFGISLLVAALVATSAHAAERSALDEKIWIHGSPDCAGNRDPPIEVFRFDAATYILRQSKCVHFEAPFVYVLFGEHTVFVQDTGATEDAARFPLYDTVRRLIEERVGATEQTGSASARIALLVTHSHSHGDHVAGDAQFRGKPGVTLVQPTAQAVRRHFGFANWPEGMATVDLGGRKLIVLPTPGHQDESLAVYDAATGWLLTGDSIYPGRLYVNDWAAYRSSMQRLAAFARAHPVSAVMGTHIEMSRTGQEFPAGSTFQPNEAPLPLAVQDLVQLDEALREAGDEPQKIATARYVVTPIGPFRRAVSRFLKALGVR